MQYLFITGTYTVIYTLTSAPVLKELTIEFTFIHMYTKEPINLPACPWSVGRNRSTWRKPKLAQGEHANSMQVVLWLGFGPMILVLPLLPITSSHMLSFLSLPCFRTILWKWLLVHLDIHVVFAGSPKSVGMVALSWLPLIITSHLKLYSALPVQQAWGAGWVLCKPQVMKALGAGKGPAYTGPAHTCPAIGRELDSDTHGRTYDYKQLTWLHV